MVTSERLVPGDAVGLLRWQIWLVFLVPAGLRVEPLGALGSPALLFASVLTVVWVAAAFTPSGIRRCAPVRWVAAGFGMAVLVSFGLLHRAPVAADEASNADRFVLGFVALAAVALVAAEGLPNGEQVLRVIRTLVTATAVMSAIAVLQHRGVVDLVQLVRRTPGLSEYQPLTPVLARSGLARPAGTATHPIEFGVVSGVVLAFAAHLAVFDRVWGPFRRVGTLALIAVAVPISVSRSALLVAGVVGVVFVVTAPPFARRKVGWFVGGLGVAIFVLVPGLLGTLRSYVVAGRSDPSISTRTSDYAAVWPYLAERPWFGRGPGTYLPRFRILDNQYLLSLVEMGAVGLVALVALFGSVSVLGASARRWAVDERDRHLGAMFVAAGYGLIAALVTFDGMSFPMFMMVVMLVLGLAGAWWSSARTSAGASGDVNPTPVQVEELR